MLIELFFRTILKIFEFSFILDQSQVCISNGLKVIAHQRETMIILNFFLLWNCENIFWLFLLYFLPHRNASRFQIFSFWCSKLENWVLFAWYLLWVEFCSGNKRQLDGGNVNLHLYRRNFIRVGFNCVRIHDLTGECQFNTDLISNRIQTIFHYLRIYFSFYC